MQREIKFRAWDGKRMWYHDDTMAHGNVTLQFNDISGWGMYVEGNPYWVVGASSECAGKSVLMQWTGLKDKNGVDVFEGDIFDIHQTVNGCSVFYIESILPFKTIKYAKIHRLYEYNENELLDAYKSEDEKEIEVIGNIYQNPELITQ